MRLAVELGVVLAVLAGCHGGTSEATQAQAVVPMGSSVGAGGSGAGSSGSSAGSDDIACTTDADCPRLACGPCKAGDVVSRKRAQIECFRNPCPGVVASCQGGVCAVAPGAR